MRTDWAVGVETSRIGISGFLKQCLLFMLLFANKVHDWVTGCMLFLLTNEAWSSYHIRTYIVTCMRDYRQGIELNFGFIDHFNSQIVITLNQSTIAKLHTLWITRAHSKSLPAYSVFTSSYLVKASNNCYAYAPGSSPLWMAAPF